MFPPSKISFDLLEFLASTVSWYTPFEITFLFKLNIQYNLRNKIRQQITKKKQLQPFLKTIKC